MEKIKVTNGVYWVSVPEAGLRLLCGCPADSIKHLMRMGLIVSVEKNGVVYETGPSAILLADTSIQNGSFSNLAEFPILQIFYRQGKIIPGHPNNTGEKPIVVGSSNQVKAQANYIQRGKYGLLDRKEILSSGADEELARAVMRIKLAFAYGKIEGAEQLIDFRTIERESLELKPGVFLRRKDLNVYEISRGDESVTVDLNLGPHEEYEPPVRLDFHRIRREYFSIIHNGEGDGWDPTRPCMASILVYQGKIYLIDSGPNITHALTALGVSVSEIEGVFQTHAHDDHFAGLPTLVRSDHMIKYYATPLVRTSVMKKLSALMAIPEGRFSHYFEIHDLEFNSWNNIAGLEVMPVFSPHPVETNIFYFRTFWEGGYRSYAHLADITALGTLAKMVSKDPRAPGLSAELFERTKEAYLREATIKKIDSGGGMIHGDIRDFATDKSGKILISHTTSEKLSDAEMEIGSNAAFGAQDVLIESNQDYAMQSAARYMKTYFPTVPGNDLRMLLNCGLVEFNAGVNLIRRGEANQHIYLLLQGVVYLIDASRGMRSSLTAGSFIGEFSGLLGEPSETTYRSASYVKLLKVPAELYARFINRNFDFGEIVRFHGNIAFLQGTWLFGEMISSRILSKFARLMDPRKVAKGEAIEIDEPSLYILKEGSFAVSFAEVQVETLKPGGFFGEESILLKSSNMSRAVALADSALYCIPGHFLDNIPIVEWKLLETYERRIMAFGVSSVG